MESTPAFGAPSVDPASLAAAFAEVPDPRRAASVIYPLPAILAMAVAAILANHRSVLAIAEWGARQNEAMLAALGFPAGRTPWQATLRRLFRQLDGAALAARLTAYLRSHALPAPTAPAQGVAIDGKAHRGRLRFGGVGGPVHALSAFCHDQGVVLAHEPIAAGADKAEAELTGAPALLARIAWPGRVLTGDALFGQRALCQQVVAAGGDSLLVVKANQGTLYRDIQLLFAPPAGLPVALTDRRGTWTVERGHGRSVERRELIASRDLTGYLDWPAAAQVFRLERTWREHGQAKRALHYGVTSLASAAADPARLLAVRRGHWSIENRLHRRKAVNFGEDASLIHVGQGPTVMALLRDAAVNLLHRTGVRRVASRVRAHSQQPDQAVALVLGPLPLPAGASALPLRHLGIDMEERLCYAVDGTAASIDWGGRRGGRGLLRRTCRAISSQICDRITVLPALVRPPSSTLETEW